MATKIYQKKNFIILKSGKGFIVYNTKKKFEQGHTHINNYHIAKTLIDVALHGKQLKSKNEYLIKSIERIK